MTIRCFAILYYTSIEFIILSYTFLVISFALFKEYMICRISFSSFSNILPVFTCESIISNLWRICFGGSILITSPWNVLYLAEDTIEEQSSKI